MAEGKTRFRSKRLTPGKDKWRRRIRQPKMSARTKKWTDRTAGPQDIRLGKSKTRGGDIIWTDFISKLKADERIGAWLDHADGQDILQIEVAGDVLAVQAVFISTYIPGVDNDPNIVAFWEYVSKRTRGATRPRFRTRQRVSASRAPVATGDDQDPATA